MKASVSSGSRRPRVQPPVRVDRCEELVRAREGLESVHVVGHGQLVAGPPAILLVDVPRCPRSRARRHHDRIGVQDDPVRRVIEGAESGPLPGIRVVHHIFVASKAPWFEITDQLQQFAEGPPSFVPQPPR